MKRIMSLLFVLLACGVCAASLPLSRQGQQEADFYLEFLRASFATPTDMDALCHSYGKLFSQTPDNKYLRRHMLLCALEKKDMQAAQTYSTFFTQGENDGEDLAVYAYYQWRLGNLAQAQQYYEQALDKSPDDARILYQYLLLLSLIDVDRAAQKLQERKAQFPDQAAVLDFETGNLYLRHRDVKNALKYYQAATQRDPDYAEPYLARAELYEHNSQFFLMLHELESLEKIGYQSAPMYSRMGAVYSLVKDFPRAREYFLKAKSLDKGDVPAGYFLAIEAEEQGDFKQAAQYLRETADYEQSSGKWLQVSFYEQQAGDTKAALKTLEQAYQRFEQNVEIGYFYALLLHDEKQYRQAARVLEGVLQTNPRYENARLAYAFTLESLGKYKEMEDQARLLWEQNPSNAAAYNLVGFSLADRNIRLDQAQQYIAKALELAPQDLSFRDSQAWVYYRQGKYEQARDLLESLDAQFIEGHTDVQYHLGAIYAALGEVEKARHYLQQATDIPQAQTLLKRLPVRP